MPGAADFGGTAPHWVESLTAAFSQAARRLRIGATTPAPVGGVPFVNASELFFQNGLPTHCPAFRFAATYAVAARVDRRPSKPVSTAVCFLSLASFVWRSWLA